MMSWCDRMTGSEVGGAAGKMVVWVGGLIVWLALVVLGVSAADPAAAEVGESLWSSPPVVAVLVVLGVIVVVNVLHHLLRGRRAEVPATKLESVPPGHPASQSQSVQSSAVPSFQSPAASAVDPHLLLLKPIEEQEAIRASIREAERARFPLQELIDDAESNR